MSLRKRLRCRLRPSLASRSLAVLAGVRVLSFLRLRTGAGLHKLSKEEGRLLTVQEVDHQLVGAHHDGGVGNLAYQVGGEAAVQGAVALLFGHCC